MKYLSIILLVALWGCKEKKEDSVASKLAACDTCWTIVSNTDSMTSTLIMDSTLTELGTTVDRNELYQKARGVQRMKCGWLSTHEYDIPKKHKKKAVPNNGGEWNIPYNFNYRKGIHPDYDSSYTITWDSSKHHYYDSSGILGTIEKGNQLYRPTHHNPYDTTKDVYPYTFTVHHDGSISINDLYHCLLMSNATGIVILDTLINKYEFNSFFNYHK